MSQACHLQAFSPAKLNLFLHITGRRPDGYHLLQSLFCPITLGDQVHLHIEEKAGAQGLVVTRTGDLVHIPADQDLTVKACKAWVEQANLARHCALFVHIHVEKRTPEEAGLGGGSSNAATVLKLLQDHFNHPVNPNTLHQIATRLGADVPFFLQDEAAFVEGIGEQLTPIPGLRGEILVYKPPLSCPTAQIFSDPQLTRNASDVKIAVFDSARRVNRDSNESQGCVGFYRHLALHTQNAMQAVVANRLPEWARHFEVFSNCTAKADAMLTRMTGSGSAMFAVFASPSQRNKAMECVAREPLLQQGRWFECQIGSKSF
ncbi:4-(cytidine 5'-diphospho)-2-C-methyl-D-erythritol kinase [Limnobacter sp.]|uniref:4-(cytidine 5'-diphospho)-2-C-methyl-D-erythritol kinase n=1 Tax=Limnobacter sp. TaxID=2003368 RepID=UPI003514CA51